MRSDFLATTSVGLRRAAPDGDGWRVAGVAPGHEVRCLAIDPADPRVVVAGTNDGVLRSGDRGASWQASGLSGVTVKSLALSPAQPDRIYAGAKPARVFRSDDGELSWAELESFRRIRGRRLWFSPAEPPFSAYVLGLAVSPVNPDLVVAGIEFGAVVRSVDGGQTWEGHRPGAIRDCHSLAAHATEPGWFYQGGASSRGGGAFSRDGGARWERLPGLDRKYGWAAAADIEDPWLQYVSVSPGVKAHSAHADAAIFRSQGGPWERLAGGLPDPLEGMPYALITGPGPGNVIAGLSNGEVWESLDAGDNWKRLDLRFPDIERCLVRVDGV